MTEGPTSTPPPEPPPPAVEASQQPAPTPAAPQSWLRENRLKVALGIAVAEALFVALEEDFSRITVIVIAIPVILFWLLAGRTLESEWGRDVSWILAMSQALAICAAVIAWIIPVAVLVIAGIFGAVIVYLLYHDRPDESARSAK